MTPPYLIAPIVQGILHTTHYKNWFSYLFSLAFHQVSDEWFEDRRCEGMDPMSFHRESGSSFESKAILKDMKLSIVRYSCDEGLQNPKLLSF